MSDRPDLDEAIRIAQEGGLNVVGGKYAPPNKTTPDDWLDDLSYHHFRVCQNCGWTWGGLHCSHDGYQNPCPHCHKKPDVLPDPYTDGCECQLAIDMREVKQAINAKITELLKDATPELKEEL